MQNATKKEILTTGEVARICHVAPRTVSKWFDEGKLRGYRIPGSRDRRIPVEQLVSFMRVHGMPMEGLDAGLLRVLIMDGGLPADVPISLQQSNRYEVRTAGNGFEAGVIAQQFRPHVIVLDTDAGWDEAVNICTNIKLHYQLQAAKVLAVSRDANDRRFSSFDGWLCKPYNLTQLVRAIEQASNLI